MVIGHLLGTLRSSLCFLSCAFSTSLPVCSFHVAGACIWPSALHRLVNSCEVSSLSLLITSRRNKGSGLSFFLRVDLNSFCMGFVVLCVSCNPSLSSSSSMFFSHKATF